ncbi:CdaR family protein [Gorillibacterium sp. sgz5001074]|uniref:CdaR family protein n=1 Tax=Gorillibacterium sp. sgz5001074 TaxID=3446695 RepID=UPI003F6783F5
MDKWLRNTNVVKVVALAIGIMLWVVVHLDVETNSGKATPSVPNTTISNVMVQALYDETQFGIVSIEPSEVTVTLIGDTAKIRELNPSNFKIVADLTKLTAGTYELPVTADSPLPKGVSLEIVPNKVKVTMEEKKMKEIPVQIDVTGKPAAGFRAGQPIVNPGRVYFSAPASKIENAVTAKAEVNIEGAKANVTKKVKLIAYDKAGHEVKGSISPPVLEIEIPVTLPLKSMPLQIKWTGQPAKGFAVASVQQSVEQITVYGTQDVLDRMEFYEGVEIDISGIKEDKVYTVDIPVKNKDIRVEPGKLEVKVIVVPSVTKVLEQVPVTLNTPNEGLKAALTAPANGRISLAVEGASAVVEKLKPQDLVGLVNVSNLSPGSYELPISVSLPPFVKRTDTPVKATVQLTAAVKAEGLATETAASPAASASAPTATPAPASSQPAASTPAAGTVTPAASNTPSPEAR